MLAGRPVICSATEVSIFDPPSGQTCGTYLSSYISSTGGSIQNPSATSSCQYCSLTVADQFLAGSWIYFGERWRNFGILFAFIGFNIALAIATYWLFRVANLKSLTAKMHKTKKGAKAHQGMEKAAEGGANVAAQGAHPGERSGEKDAGTA